MTDGYGFSKGATISLDEHYRYHLWRHWGSGPPMAFVMLNPSTADASINDPTIRRCIGFAKREGCGSVEVVNLFALRSPNPTDLMDSRDAGIDPEGSDNLAAVCNCIDYVNAESGYVVAAWGAHKEAQRSSVYRYLRSEFDHGFDTYQCLGTTADGSPRHPLYVRGDAPLVDWP